MSLFCEYACLGDLLLSEGLLGARDRQAGIADTGRGGGGLEKLRYIGLLENRH